MLTTKSWLEEREVHFCMCLNMVSVEGDGGRDIPFQGWVSGALSGGAPSDSVFVTDSCPPSEKKLAAETELEADVPFSETGLVPFAEAFLI